MKNKLKKSSKINVHNHFKMEHFKHAHPYNYIKTDHEDKFEHVMNYLKNCAAEGYAEDFIVQVVFFPNFNAHLKKIEYVHVTNAGISVSASLSEGYSKVNSFKNYRTNPGIGHIKGMFYELNLYMNKSTNTNRKSSTLTGNTYVRDASHDLLINQK